MLDSRWQFLNAAAIWLKALRCHQDKRHVAYSICVIYQRVLCDRPGGGHFIMLVPSRLVSSALAIYSTNAYRWHEPV